MTPPERAPGLRIADGVALPDDLELGAHVTIHAGSDLGRGCAVQDGAVAHDHALAETPYFEYSTSVYAPVPEARDAAG